MGNVTRYGRASDRATRSRATEILTTLLMLVNPDFTETPLLDLFVVLDEELPIDAAVGESRVQPLLDGQWNAGHRHILESFQKAIVGSAYSLPGLADLQCRIARGARITGLARPEHVCIPELLFLQRSAGQILRHG